jgi:hypothetical protein
MELGGKPEAEGLDKIFGQSVGLARKQVSQLQGQRRSQPLIIATYPSRNRGGARSQGDKSYVPNR